MALDEILTETPYTKRILTLKTSLEHKIISFKSKNYKLYEDEAQEEVTAELSQKNIPEDDLMINSVNIRWMNLNWLTRKTSDKSEQDPDFLDLVEILNDTTNQSVIQTKFVSSLLQTYWDIYKWGIFWT